MPAGWISLPPTRSPPNANATTTTALNHYQLGAFFSKWAEDWRDVQDSPAWAVRLLERAEAAYQTYLTTKTDVAVALEDILDISHLSALGTELYLGYDIARHRDLSVIWLLDRIRATLVTRAVIVLARQPFFVQKKVLWSLLETAPIRRACLDKTGMGEQLAEESHDRFGSVIEPITFSSASKEVLASGLRQTMEDKRVAVPVSPVIRNSLHSVKRIATQTGAFRYDAEKSEPTGHADHFWALALAVQAATDPAVVQTIGRAGSPIEYLDAPEFQTYWDADAKLMTAAVRKIGKVE